MSGRIPLARAAGLEAVEREVAITTGELARRSSVRSAGDSGFYVFSADAQRQEDLNRQKERELVSPEAVGGDTEE